MNEIAQVMNTIPQDKQQILHDKKQLIKNTFNLSLDLVLGVTKIRRIYLLVIVIRLFKIQPV